MSVGGVGGMGVGGTGGAGWKGPEALGGSNWLGGNPREHLASALRTTFGLAKHEPTTVQLDDIIVHVNKVRRSSTPSYVDWRAAVERVGASIGSISFGIDNSDLNALLDRILGPAAKPPSQS